MSSYLVSQRIEEEEEKRTSHLDLSFCALDEIPEEVGKMAWLNSLNLSNNRIGKIEQLQRLTRLTVLFLHNNRISKIEGIQGLTNLMWLSLSNNHIGKIEGLQGLTSLSRLYLRDNQISNIEGLQELTGLTKLVLGSNQITDISFLEILEKLRSLELQDNQITDISPLLSHIRNDPFGVRPINISTSYTFDNQTKGINLANNPILVPPMEVVSRGNEAIIKYFDDLANQGAAKLYEAKLLIVGDGGTGKTSLAEKMKALDNKMPKGDKDRTKGIDIQVISINNIKEPEEEFLMNVWDFGGQGYYHSTHQFFLTKRSLYVLLNNTRTNKTDFNDWLQTISLFSDNSPVILVENEFGGSKSELDERGLRQFFDNILRVKVADISNTSDGRLQELIADIHTEIQRLPHVGTELPKQWVKIREELKEVAKIEAHISDQQFYRICEKHKITEKGARQRLGDLFHDLGIFLHFREDSVLKRLVILRNSWATKGVYTILDNTTVRAQNGYFTIEQAEDIWMNTPYEDYFHEMVGLMEKFRLCYRIPYSIPVAYISPNLLPIEKPKYNWNQQQNLVIHYDYEFMPKGLLGMLIVELHRYVKDIKNLAWRSGCIFHHQNTHAQVIETYGKRKLEIRVRGAHIVQLSTIIANEIDQLNASFKRIKVKKNIPCSCRECKDATTPHFFDYDTLMRRKEKNKLKVECELSFEDVNVLEILEATFDQQYAMAPTIRQLVRRGKLKEAIDTFEDDFPNEGTLLLSRYNQLQRFRYLGTMTTEEWNVNRNQIAESLLEFSKLEPSELPKTIKAGSSSGKHPLEQKLDTIQDKLEGQDLILNEILNRSQVHQDELLELLGTLESEEKGISESFATDIIAVIERGMTDFMQKAPDAKTIIADWQEASKQLKLAADSKVKLKWTVPFLFMKLEKEVAWNGMDYFRAIKEDIQRGVQGDWSEMFVTKEE